MKETELRAEMVALGRSLFDRGYVAGGAGNFSARLDADRILATPSGSCLGRLYADSLSVVDFRGGHVSGDPPSKEVRFHLALYRDEACGAVVHLHSTWSTLLSCLNDVDPESVIRPFTPYYVMKIGRLQMIPYYPPGDAGIAREMEKWAGKRNAFLLRNHGPVVTGKTLSAAVDLMEELEETAKLAWLLRDRDVRYLTDEEIAVLRNRG